MAPAKGKETVLELCTSTITLGSSIAVHLLDYLSIVKDPPYVSQCVTMLLNPLARLTESHLDRVPVSTLVSLVA